MELTDSLKALFIETSKALKASSRRLFMARTVKELGPGGQRRAERALGWNRITIRKGTHEGSVANFAQGALKGQLPLSKWELSGQRVEQFGRSEALVPLLDHQLSFLDHVHEFDPDQRVLSRRKRLEPQHEPGHPLYTSMILLHDIV